MRVCSKNDGLSVIFQREEVTRVMLQKFIGRAYARKPEVTGQVTIPGTVSASPVPTLRYDANHPSKTRAFQNE
jgi:hypothetical protein